MCEKPKDDEATEPKTERAQPRSYYYDDAHGYEEFDPEDPDPDDEEDDRSA